METIKLNKISTRYYWEHFLLVPDNLLKPLFYPIALDIDEQSALFNKFVCIVNIETSSYCNRKCSYCPVSLDDSRKNQLYMTDELFNKILDELESINYSSTIVFNLYNEPLADKNIFLRIKQARKSLPYSFLMFNSNGDYIDSSSLNTLSEMGLNALFVTLHPPINKAYQLDDRLTDFQKLFKKIGRDISQAEISAPLENGHIESNIDWNGMKLRVMANNWLKYGNSRAGTLGFLNASITRTLPCARPLRELTISYNGNIFPCCQFFPDSLENQKYIIDNLSSKSIFEIYASHSLAKWRKNLFTFGKKESPCDSCRDEDFSKEDSLEIREAILNRLKIGAK
ncbi:SPASM domain-containing protein [Candidatus Marithioploca araucensis]|uniref:SPASM domain-containing protein n=1 Tax=Candidatus Marithioploca araucensis TaxID=70273 RepID=A0ABT7VUB8_9GAMM|nr:SPASM domain-containing protein [Candidatus Marithioploca araucensis]